MPTAIEREAQAIKSEAKKILLIVVVISLAVYAFTGTAQVGQEQTGLIVRFGKVVRARGPGLHWGFPWPIDKVVLVPTGGSHSLDVSNFNMDPNQVKAQMEQLNKNIRFKAISYPARATLANPHLVTADLNIIHIKLKVIYRITEPELYYAVAGDASDMTQTDVQQIARAVVADSLIQAVA